MSEPINGDTRISVSREALRADLTEMELRMRIWIGDELDKKATSADLAVLRTEISLTARALNDSKEQAATALSESKDKAAAALATTLTAAETLNTARFQKIENLQSRLVGGMILAALILPVAASVITKVLS